MLFEADICSAPRLQGVSIISFPIVDVFIAKIEATDEDVINTW